MEQFVIAQISDPHVRSGGRLCYGQVEPARLLRACVDALLSLRLKPDVVLVSGDLVHAGAADEYAVLREILAALPMPYFVIPGNHDAREEMFKAFAADAHMRDRLPPSAKYFHYVVDDYPLRIIALDTLIPGQDGGELCVERLAWLEQQLHALPPRPTVIVMHHPPFAGGIEFMDELALAGADALAAILRPHAHIERVLCGHVHRSIQMRYAGTIASTCPSSAHQITLDLVPSSPSSFMLEPPGFQLHRWTARDGLATHTGVVGQYGGPFSFGG